MTLEIGFESLGQRAEMRSQFDENSFWGSIRNERSGKIRLRSARSYFNPLVVDDVPHLLEGFKAWRDEIEFLAMKGEKLERGVKTGEKRYFGVKCSKRGNDVFASRLDSRLGFLKSNEEFFDPEDFEDDFEGQFKNHSNKKVKTRLLWITLTCDPSRYSLDEAWERSASEFNLWITNLRNRYGKISYTFFPQAFPDSKGKAFCYPHFHGVVYFEDAEFTVFRRMEKDRAGKLGLVYRVEEKHEIEDQGKWPAWIDIKALSSMKAVWNYAKRHCYNAGYGESEEASLNNSVMWLYRKRSFNMSGDFRKRYTEFITSLHKSKVCEQLTLDGGVCKDWVFSCLGVFSVFELCIVGDPPSWTVSLSEDQVEKLMERFKVG